MKQKTILLPHCELLVVELPDGAKNIRIDTNQSVIPYGKEVKYEVPPTKESYGYEDTEGFSLPYGNWQHLGAVCDVSDEQVDGFMDKSIYTGLYGHYVKDISLNIYCYKNATESFNTLLTANGVVFENPLGDFDSFDKLVYNHSKERLKEWQEAQQKVWDKERTHLFIKQKQR